MNHTTKTATLGIRATAVITAVTLALLTATVASMIPVQNAHASCITSPKGQIACSGGGTCFNSPLGSACSGGPNTLSCNSKACASSTGSVVQGLINACSSSSGSTSENPGHPSASSGRSC
jgi:hypothetical protein